MDNTMLLVGGLGLILAIVVAIFWMKKTNSADDVKRIEPKAQERSKAGSESKVKANTAKTAQLEALRDRLSDGKTVSAAPSDSSTKKVVPKKTVEAQSTGANVVGEKAVQTSSVHTNTEKLSPVSKTEESWQPENDSSSVNKFLMQKDVVDSQQPQVKNDVIGSLHEIHPIKTDEAPSGKTIINDQPVKSIPEPEKSTVKTGKPLILLVDDSKVIRVKTEKLLSAAGYEVALAIDGMDALSKLGSIRPEVIITDIEMPNLDGFGLVRSVKGNLQTSEIPIIVMTSHVNLHLDIAATEGINGFLPKPFNDQDLLDQVSYLVNG